MVILDTAPRETRRLCGILLWATFVLMLNWNNNTKHTVGITVISPQVCLLMPPFRENQVRNRWHVIIRTSRVVATRQKNRIWERKGAQHNSNLCVHLLYSAYSASVEPQMFRSPPCDIYVYRLWGSLAFTLCLFQDSSTVKMPGSFQASSSVHQRLATVTIKENRAISSSFPHTPACSSHRYRYNMFTVNDSAGIGLYRKPMAAWSCRKRTETRVGL